MAPPTGTHNWTPDQWIEVDLEFGPCLDPPVDIVVEKQMTNASPIVSDSFFYTVTVTNQGSSTATNVIVKDLLPSGVTLNAILNPLAQSATYNVNTGELKIPSLPENEVVTLSINVTVDNDACGVISNTASLISLDQVDINSNNDVSTAEFSLDPCVVPCPFPKTTVITGGIDDDYRDDNIELTFKTPDLNTTMSNIFGVGYQQCIAFDSYFGSGFCSEDVFGHSFTNLPKNIIEARLEIDLRTRSVGTNGTELDTIYLESLSNNSQFAWSSLIADLPQAQGQWTGFTQTRFDINLKSVPIGQNTINLLNQINLDRTLDVVVEDTTSVDFMQLTLESCSNTPEVDIAIDKQFNGSPFPVPGQKISYDVTVRNHGPHNATNVIVNDLLPAGITYGSPVISGGGATYDISSGDLVIPSLPAQSSVTLNIKGNIDGITCNTEVVNTATLASVDQTDTNADNNESSVKFLMQPCMVQCPNPLGPRFSNVDSTTDVFIVGLPDDFRPTGSDQQPLPSTSLQTYITNTFGGFISRQFDSLLPNELFGHTFTNLPENIVAGNLEMRLRGISDAPEDDTLHLNLNGPATAFEWESSLSALNQTGNSWSINQNAKINMDLQNLPSNTNILTAINENQILDVFFQDDTAVDYLALAVVSCPPPSTGQLGGFTLRTLPSGPGSISGSFYNLATDGQGGSLQVIDSDQAILTFYSYDAQGNPLWLIGLGSIDESSITFDEMQITSGGIFGPNFNPNDVQRINWGSAKLEFEACDTASMQYASASGTDVGTLDLIRLTGLSGNECREQSAADVVREAPPTEQDKYTGLWYDLTHDGEGVVVEMLNDSRVLVYWYTYDSAGNQVWIVGSGTFSGNTITIDESITATGGVFGTGLNPGNIVREPWGSFSINFTSCNEATLQYNSTVSGFGSGQQNLIRLSSVEGLSCQ